MGFGWAAEASFDRFAVFGVQGGLGSFKGDFSKRRHLTSFLPHLAATTANTSFLAWHRHFVRIRGSHSHNAGGKQPSTPPPPFGRIDPSPDVGFWFLQVLQA